MSRRSRSHEVDCPECNGGGEVLGSGQHPNNPYARYYKCETCNGRGYVYCEWSCDECNSLLDTEPEPAGAQLLHALKRANAYLHALELEDEESAEVQSCASAAIAKAERG